MKFTKVDDYFKDVNSIGISGHVKPDGDCIGSTLAMYNYITENYPDIKVDIFLEPIPSVFKFLKNSDKINSEYDIDASYDLFIALDCGDIGRLGKAGKYLKGAKNSICIDHHISNVKFADNSFVYPNISSASEVLFEMLDTAHISTAVAECIYTGIVHDTGVFRYSSTTKRTMEIAGFLMEKGIKFTDIIGKTFYEKTYEQNRILGCALVKSRRYLDDKVIASVLNIEEMRDYKVSPRHLEGIVSQLNSTRGVEVAIFIYQNEGGTYKVSLRSVSYVDVAAIAQKYGGGGHKRAAGVTMNPGQDANEILEIILDEIKNQI